MFSFRTSLLLAIDAGNTNIVFALYDGSKAVAQFRMHTNTSYTADDFAVWLNQILALHSLKFERIGKVIIASVVPVLDFALRRFCENYIHAQPVIVSQSINLGLQLRVPHPEQVGADRIVNAVAAKQHYSLPAVVIDFGTATTFDVLDANGDYVGGIIAPGPQQSLHALVAAAAKLPYVNITQPANVMGLDTVSAMQSGLFWGYVGLIEGLLKRLQEEQGSFASIIATGGLAPLFADAIPAIQEIDPDLTLKGLLALWQLNK